MKFFTINVGDYFYIEEKVGFKHDPKIQKTLCKKVSALGYTMAGEEVLGEHSIDPQTDSKIVLYEASTTDKAAKKAVVKKTAGKKAVVKKAAKKVAKKAVSKKKSKVTIH